MNEDASLILVSLNFFGWTTMRIFERMFKTE